MYAKSAEKSAERELEMAVTRLKPPLPVIQEIQVLETAV